MGLFKVRASFDLPAHPVRLGERVQALKEEAKAIHDKAAETKQTLQAAILELHRLEQQATFVQSSTAAILEDK